MVQPTSSVPPAPVRPAAVALALATCVLLVIPAGGRPEGRSAAPTGVPAQDAAALREAAEAAFAAGDWEAAAREYRRLLELQPENAPAWLQLGLSLHSLGELGPARQAYRQAEEHGGGTPVAGRALYHRARAEAAGGDADGALATLEELAALGASAPLVVALGSAEEFDAVRADPRFEPLVDRMRPCTAPEYRQFDFWVGAWEVHAGDRVAGRNVITAVLGGCALHEDWESAGGVPGHSYSFYDAARESWHQTWIDAGGSALYLDGGWNGEAMVMGDGTNRVTWTPLEGGRVRQHWERTIDGGETWTTVFDGEYRPVVGDARDDVR